MSKEQYKDEIDELRQKSKERAQALNNAKMEVDKLRKELNTEKKKDEDFNNEKLRTLGTENSTLKEQLAQERGEKMELEEKMEKAYKDLQVKHAEDEQLYKNEIDKLKQSMKSKVEELRQKEKEQAEVLDSTREETDKLRREFSTEKRKYQNFCDEKLRKLETENQMLNEDLAQEKGEKRELEEKMEKAYKDLQAKHTGDEQLYKDEIDKLKQSLKSKVEELRQKEKEQAKVWDRLRKEIGNIADLSDSNRPTKIAEKYNELYDNEWTDALETLTNKRMSEETVIHQLLEILQTCYKFCQGLSREQMNNFYKQLSESYSTQSHCTTSQIGNIPPDIERLLIECRKTKGLISVDDLYNEYVKQTARHTYAHYVQEYVKKCLEVCWLMLLQDPPVAFSEACRTGDTFDTVLYKAYTKSGDKVSFTVWLPLLLHAKGPLLAKGVVQPFSTESSSIDRISKSASVRSTSHRDDRRTNAYVTNQHQTASRNTYHGTSQDISGERPKYAWTEHKPDQNPGTWFSQSNPSTPDKYDQGTEYHKRNNVGNENKHLGYPVGHNAHTHNVMTNRMQNYPAYSEPCEVMVQGVPYVKFQGRLYTQAQWCSYGSALLRGTTSSSSTA